MKEKKERKYLHDAISKKTTKNRYTDAVKDVGMQLQSININN